MDFGGIFNIILAPVLTLVVGALKKKFPDFVLLHSAGTMITTGVLATFFSFLLSVVGIVNFPDQMGFVEFMKTLGANIAMAGFLWEAGAKKLFKPKTP